MKKKQHEKVLDKKSMKLKEIRKEATQTANLNDRFDDKLREENASLFERKHISQDMSKL